MSAVNNVATKSHSRTHISIGILGNILEHYDTALFGLLAPVLAPLFFPTATPLTALILTYAILPLDLLSRPIGALIFGKIGDRMGRKTALSTSILGTALMTAAIGFLPTHTEIGPVAPILLATVRFLQKFCAAGEYIGGAIFVLEQNTKKEIEGFLGSLYSCSTILGILLASTLISLFESFEILNSHWRALFWIAFATSGITFYMRTKVPETYSPSSALSKTKAPIWKNMWHFRKQLLAIATVSGVSYATYEIVFLLPCSYFPLISHVTLSQMLQLNTPLLLLDMALLPLFGWLSDKYTPQKLLLISGAILFTTSLPLFALCYQASFYLLLTIRIFWLCAGVAFSAPFHCWAQNLVPQHLRYTVLSFGYAIGSQLFGAPFASITLWLHKTSASPSIAAAYFMLLTCTALICIKLATSSLHTEEKN